MKKFELINNKKSKRHFFDKQKVYYLDDDKKVYLIPSAKLDYLSILNTFFSKYKYYNKKEIFYKQYKIPGADYDSFKVVHNRIAKDKKRVYFGNKIIVNADSDTFEVLINSYDNKIIAGKDRFGIYKLSFDSKCSSSSHIKTLKPIQNIDSESFKFLSRYWFEDNQYIICRFNPIKEIDKKTFKILFSDGNNEWAKDKNNLYNGKDCKTYYEINGKNFKHLNAFWGKDNQSVFSFLEKRIIPCGDAKTFEIIGFDGEAQDKNFFYLIDDKKGIMRIKK